MTQARGGRCIPEPNGAPWRVFCAMTWGASPENSGIVLRVFPRPPHFARSEFTHFLFFNFSFFLRVFGVSVLAIGVVRSSFGAEGTRAARGGWNSICRAPQLSLQTLESRPDEEEAINQPAAREWRRYAQCGQDSRLWFYRRSGRCGKCGSPCGDGRTSRFSSDGIVLIASSADRSCAN